MKSSIKTVIVMCLMYLPLVVQAKDYVLNKNGSLSSTKVSKPKQYYCNFSKLSIADVKTMIIKISISESFDIKFALAIAKSESGWGQHLYSRKKDGSIIAVGIMQLIPATARRFKVNECNHRENILGGIRYLKWLFNKFNNPMLVAAAYNSGEGRIYQYGGIPPFKETVKYTANVMNAYNGLKPIKCKKCKSIPKNKIAKLKIIKKAEPINVGSTVQLIGIRSTQSSVIHVE